MSSRRSTLGIPLGVAAAVLLAVVAVFATDFDRAPRRLPIGLSAGRSAGEDSAAAAPSTSRFHGGGYQLAIPVPGGLPDEARAGVMTRRPADRDAVVRLARALRLDGEPVRANDGWELLDDGIGLRVGDEPGNPWHYGLGAVCRGDHCGKTRPEPAVDLPAVDASGATPADGAASTGAPAPYEAKPTGPPAPSSPTAHPKPEATSSPCDPAACTPQPCPPDDAACCAANDFAPHCGPAPCRPDTKCVSPCPPPPPECAGMPCDEPACRTPRPLPDKEAALEIARKLMAVSGFADPVLRAEPGYEGWHVGGDYRFQGLRVLHSGFAFDLDHENRPRSANGLLATPEPGDRYPLLGVEAAIARAAGGTTGGAEPTIGCDALIPECQQRYEPRRVTAVELGLATMPARDETYLVPAWLLTVEGSPYPEAVVALPDEYLAETGGGGTCRGDCDAPVSDTDAPAPPDGGAGGGSGGSTGGAVPPQPGGSGAGGGTDGSTGGAVPPDAGGAPVPEPSPSSP